jgi:hypothetical protein
VILKGLEGTSLAGLLVSSYAAVVGEPLPGVPGMPGTQRVTEGLTDSTVADWLYTAPFGLLAHDESADPLFVYANLMAQEHFGYDWDEFVGLPSRLSAGDEARESRRVFMDAVRRQGYADGYRGLRVAKSGHLFWIEDVTIWNIPDPSSPGRLAGQAALIRGWGDA